MPSASDIRAGKAFVELYTKNGPLYKGLKAAQKRISAWAKDVTAAGTKVFGLGAAITGPIIAASKAFSSMGDTVQKVAARTGIAAEAISELSFAAGMSGTDLTTVEAAIRRMQRSLTDAARGLSTPVDALDMLGLSVARLQGLSPEDQFQAIADGIAAIDDPSRKAAAAMMLLGRSGTMLLPMLDEMAELRQQARDLGLIISTEDADRAALFNDQLDILRRVLMQGVFAAGSSVADVLGELTMKIVKVVTTATTWIKENKGLFVSLLKLGAIISGVGAGLIAVGTIGAGLAGLLGGMASAVTMVGGAFSTIGSVLGFLVSPIGLVIAALAGLAVRWAKSGYSAREAAAAIGGALASAWQWATDAFAQAAQWITAAFHRIVAAATSAASVIGSAMASVASAIGGWFAAAASMIGSALTSAWQSATGSLARAIGWMSNAFGPIISAAKAAAAAIAGPFALAWTAASAALSRAVRWMAGTLAGIVGVARSAAVTIGGWFAAAASMIGSALASAWQWATDSLAQAVQWIAGAFSTIIDSAKSTALAIGGWLASAWEGITGAVSGGAGAMTAALDGIRAKFGEILTFAQDVFAGIGDAMAAGDLTLAAEVLWAGIKLAWITGMEWIRTQWTELRFDLESIWGQAAFGVLDTLNWLWSEMVTGFWAVADSIVDAWKSAEKLVAKGVGWIIAKLNKLDPAEVIANLEQDYARQQAGRDTGRADRDAANKAAADARYQAIEAARQQWGKDAAAKRDERISATGTDLDDARKKYAEAREAAAQARAAAEKEKADGQDKDKKLGGPGGLPAIAAADGGLAKSSGFGSLESYQAMAGRPDPSLQTLKDMKRFLADIRRNTGKKEVVKEAVPPAR